MENELKNPNSNVWLEKFVWSEFEVRFVILSYFVISCFLHPLWLTRKEKNTYFKVLRW